MPIGGLFNAYAPFGLYRKNLRSMGRMTTYGAVYNSFQCCLECQNDKPFVGNAKFMSLRSGL